MTKERAAIPKGWPPSDEPPRRYGRIAYDDLPPTTCGYVERQSCRATGSSRTNGHGRQAAESVRDKPRGCKPAKRERRWQRIVHDEMAPAEDDDLELATAVMPYAKKTHQQICVRKILCCCCLLYNKKIIPQILSSTNYVLIENVCKSLFIS